jgi:hypothetical protein
MLEGLKPPPKSNGSCKVGRLASTLDEADKKILLGAIEDSTNWPVKTLAKALSDRGLQISDSPLYNHRSKACACYRG